MNSLSLFACCVLIWGTTWFAIIFQLGTVPPEMSVAYRFVLASLLLFAFCALRRLPLRFGRRDHIRFAAQGAAMFCASYILVYHAERYVVSGLVAVGYSAMPLINMLAMRALFGTAMTRQVLIGGVLGVLGIVLIYGAEFAKLAGDERTVMGATLTVLSVLASCCGSLVATHNQKHHLPIWQTMAYGMAYGGLLSLAIGLAMGGTMVWDARPAYLASLVYLALFGSVLAFGGYLYLMSHIGAARASYIGVMVPVVALIISSVFENFTWQASTFVGVAVSVAGNIIILQKKAAA